MPFETPLFPLHSVLFPGGRLSMRVFEPRYLDMVSRCLKNDTGFGVCLIREGEEVGEAATTYEIGTFGRIHRFDRRADGLLGIVLAGESRFRILETAVQRDKLVVASVELLEPDPALPLPVEYSPLKVLLRNMLEQLGEPYSSIKTDYDDAGWVASRLTELLPVKLIQKQYLLQMDDPLQRLERLCAILESGALAATHS